MFVQLYRRRDLTSQPQCSAIMLARLRRHRALATALAMCLCFAVRELRDRPLHSMHVLPLVVLPKAQPLTQSPAKGATDAPSEASPPPQILELSPAKAPAAASPPPQQTEPRVQHAAQNRSMHRSDLAAAGIQQAVCSDGSRSRKPPQIVLLMAGACMPWPLRMRTVQCMLSCTCMCTPHAHT